MTTPTTTSVLRLGDVQPLLKRLHLRKHLRGSDQQGGRGGSRPRPGSSMPGIASTHGKLDPSRAPWKKDDDPRELPDRPTRREEQALVALRIRMDNADSVHEWCILLAEAEHTRRGKPEPRMLTVEGVLFPVEAIRKGKYTPAQWLKAARLKAGGESLRGIEAATGIPRTAIGRVLRDA